MSLARRLLLLGSLTLGPLGCGNGTAGEDPSGLVSDRHTLEAREHEPRGLIELMARPVLTERAHEGVRRVDLYDRAENPTGFSRRLSYRERIVTDGRGEFAIEPVEALAGVTTGWETFQLLFHNRQGYLFQYRDFSVRDDRVFRKNWSVTDTGETDEICGRTCSKLVVQRRDGADLDGASTYEVWLDEEGFRLAYRELDADGVPIAEMRYERFSESPDTSSVLWHTARVDERALDPVRSLATQLDERDRKAQLQPRLLPRGYELSEASVLRDSDDRRWIKRVYTDGVEPLFFLAGLPDGDGSAADQPEEPDRPDRVGVFDLGRATALQGHLRGADVIAVGNVSEDELLDFLESALP